MKPEEIFKEAEEHARELLSLLEDGVKLFPSTKVPKELLKQGLTYYKGLVLPLKSVSHKYLQNYEVPFLMAYISLFRKVLEEAPSYSNEFAFRPLLEMGCDDSYILFDGNVTQEEKRLFIDVLLLADYSSIETSMKALFKGWFNELYKESEGFLKEKLTEKQMVILEKLYEVMNNSPLDEEAFTNKLKQTRQLINDIKAGILNTHEQKKALNRDLKFKRMKSGEAHTLHGNAFLIEYRMSQQPSQNHLFRVYSYLMISGNELVIRLSNYHKEKQYIEKVTSYIQRDTIFRKKFGQSWTNL